MNRLLTLPVVLCLPLVAALTLGASARGADEPLWTELPAGEDGEEARASTESFALLAARLSPTVVHILVKHKLESSTSARLGWSSPESLYRPGQGTGLVIRGDGLILTNHHVVEEAAEVRVKMADGREYAARVVGADPYTDLALLGVAPEEPLAAAPLGDSDRLRVGEWVLAIGNPLGLDHTVTAGIVSATGRKEIRPDDKVLYANFIQTDASINPGNSGGPLINMRGEVIGINAALSAAGQGIGFAIPINMAKQRLPQLAAGRVERAFLGVLTQEVTGDIAESIGMEKAVGALVARVVAGSPAAAAGIGAGDVILSFNGKPVADSRELSWLAATAPIGSEVELEVFREGKTVALRATPAPHPDDRPVVAVEVDSGGSALPDLGLVVAPLTPAERKAAAIDGRLGVRVVAVAPGGAAERGGLREGDIILRLGYVAIRSPEDLTRMVGRLAASRPFAVHLQRGRDQSWIVLVKP